MSAWGQKQELSRYNSFELVGVHEKTFVFHSAWLQLARTVSDLLLDSNSTNAENMHQLDKLNKMMNKGISD